jgi:dCTP deaminase
MPLSANQLADRLWDGLGPIAPKSAFALVPVPDFQRIRNSNAASLDLRLGRWFRTMQHTRVEKIEVEDEEILGTSAAGLTKEHYVRFNDHFVLHPGQFVIGTTLEWMRFPVDLAGYVTGKSSWGRRGLIIETAAGIHPGFTGCLTLELANVGTAPIWLNPGVQICQVFIHNVDDGMGDAVTQFVGYRKPGLGKISIDKELKALGKQYFDS